MRKPFVVAVVAVLAATATGCSAPEPAPSPSGTYPKAESVFAGALAEAKAATPPASDAQIKALEKSAKSGEMSYDEISVLLEDTFRCFDVSGVDYRRLGDWEQIPGFKVPQYSFSDPVEVGDACQYKYSEYAWEAYQTQPKVVELRAAAFEAERPQVLACLRKLGAVLDDNASNDELLQARNRLLEKAIKDGTDWVDCSTYWW